MKNILVIPILIIFLFSEKNYSQSYDSGDGFYSGFGTSISSYWGGYFGEAYQMRVLSSYDYYDDINYSNDNYDDYSIWSPYTISFTFGKHFSDNLSVEAESDFLFHFNGRVDPQFVTAEIGDQYFQDRNSYSTLFAIPISLSLKLSMEDESGGAFIKIGPAWQYTSEQYDRIRNYYSYEYYNSYSYDVYLYNVSKDEWLFGFKTGMGLKYYMSDFTYAVTELEYAYFNINPTNKTALALDRAPEAQLFSLSAKVFFDF